jgi:hypothetical protein
MPSIFRSTFTDDDIYFGEPEAAEISRKLSAACAAFSYIALCRTDNDSNAIDAMTIRIMYCKAKLYKGDLEAVLWFAEHIVSAFESEFPQNKKDVGVDLVELAGSIFHYALEHQLEAQSEPLLHRIKELVFTNVPDRTNSWNLRLRTSQIEP